MNKRQKFFTFKSIIASISILAGMIALLFYVKNDTKLFGVVLVGLVTFSVCAGLSIFFIWNMNKFSSSRIVEAEIYRCGFQEIEKLENPAEAWAVAIDCPYGNRKVVVSFTTPPYEEMNKGDWISISSPIIFSPEQQPVDVLWHAAGLAMRYPYGTISGLLVIKDPRGGPSVMAAITWCEVDGITSNELHHRILATAHLADIAISVFAGKFKEGQACA